MNESAIEMFFAKRKALWLNKNIKASMDEPTRQEKIQEAELKFHKDNWLPDAAKRACQLSMSTHPCCFSHPSARKNKNGKTTSVIATKVRKSDGYLRAGNVQVPLDALGNAAALDVYSFLTTKLSDGDTLIEHIERDSPTAQALLQIKSQSYATLREGFMAMVTHIGDTVTSSKIKQIYFPVDNGQDYHLLSLLTHSSLLFEAKKRVDALRFPDDDKKDQIKAAKVARSKGLYHPHRWREIYGLTTMAYGGTKPQNISVFNKDNGGRVHVFLSLPPSLTKRHQHFPTRDFFTQSLNPYHYRDLFHKLHALYLVPVNNQRIREAISGTFSDLTRKNLAGQASSIIGRLIETLWAVRAVSQAQYNDESSQLPLHQKIWLCEGYDELRCNESWLDKIEAEIVQWLHKAYEKVMRKKAIKLGDAEYQYLVEQVSLNREALR